MSRAWLLPEHFADVLPAQAFQIEALRRRLIDQASRRGFELVIPPLVEHLEALLSGTGHELDLQTFKLVDQLSGRMLGVRADTTPQAARIDAHLLNRSGVTRLCYCGPVLHAQKSGPGGSREPLQFGAEVFGHAGPESDMEIQDLALDVLVDAGVRQPTLDLADARILKGLLDPVGLAPADKRDIVEALSRKDAASLHPLAAALPDPARRGLLSLLDLFGGAPVLQRARQLLPEHPLIAAAIDQLEWMAGRLAVERRELQVGFDLADVGGHAYYSGVRFAIYAQGCSEALARGGRYDEVGAVFGRNRPAVGFSLDLKSLSALTEAGCVDGAIRAPWSDDLEFKREVRRLRDAGETVILEFPGTQGQEISRRCDRQLVKAGGQWGLRPI